MSQKVLILGASGRFGHNAAQAFGAAGWTVARFDRARDDLARAAIGAEVIVNAWNPAYPDWAAQVPVLHAQVRQVARDTGATVIVPGNVYVFGADTPSPWSEHSPHNATNPLGRIRVEMEAAYAQEDVRTIILRSGDFIDTQASGNWFDRVMIKPLAKGRFTYPGRCDSPRAWAYLPDMARATVALAEMRDQLPRFADIPFPGYTFSAQEIATALTRVTGRNVTARPMSWLPIRLLARVWPLARCLLEMRYLWDTPHALDGTRFAALLPDFKATPVDTALRRAVSPVPGLSMARPQPIAAE